MNLVVLHKIFLVLFSVLGSIFTLLSFYRKKDPSGAPKTRWYYWTVLVCSLIVIIFYVVLGVYLEWINGDKVNATLRITIAEPRIVNVGGTESDPFYVNADYNVVAYRTRFVHRPTVQLTNIKTKETFIYHPISDDHGGFTITDLSSGVYAIKIEDNAGELISDIIILNRANILTIDGANVWDFCAYIFDDFWSHAVEHNIYLFDAEYNTDYPIFTLSESEANVLQIFNSEIDFSNNHKLQGAFYGYPGIWELNNAVSNSDMGTMEIQVEK